MIRYLVACLCMVWLAACDQAVTPEVGVAEQAVTCSAQGYSQTFLDYGEVKLFSEENRCGAEEEVSSLACNVAAAATDSFFDPSCDAHDEEGACDYSQKPKVIKIGCSGRQVNDCTSRWDDGSCLHYECRTCCYWFPKTGLRCFTTCTMPTPG